MNLYYEPSEITVVLLAAGHGKRMLPLTAHTPKPMLKIGDQSLLEHHLKRIHQQGFKNVVINIAYLAEQIPEHLGTGERYGLHIQYSDETASGALETAGGLQKALPLIKSDPFLCINADIWTDFDFRSLLTELDEFGRLVMVTNPPHNPNGDFRIDASGQLAMKSDNANDNRTYSGIALYKKHLFSDLKAGKQALSPIFQQLIEQNKLQGVAFEGIWNDIGTPERLKHLNQRYEISQ